MSPGRRTVLVELAVSDLGVIDDLSLVFDGGMTAVTGETGAGKTLVVTAIELLVGGRADSGVVRTGCPEALVEGRFDVDGVEHVLRRVVPAEGRSRAYVDGRLATVGELAELGARLVDLHGQHTHQSLLAAGPQRDALDTFAGVDLGPLRRVRSEAAELRAGLEALGGDERARAREIDLLEHQVAEIDRTLGPADEAEALEAEEALLGDAVANREAGAAALDALAGDGGAEASVAAARAGLEGRAPWAGAAERLVGLGAELQDLVLELHRTLDTLVEDPSRLAEVQQRRAQLQELRRKYGSTDAEVRAFLDSARTRLEELHHHERRASGAVTELARLSELEAQRADEVRAARQHAAPRLAEAATAHLRELALPDAELAVTVGGGPDGDQVRFGFTANRGEPLQPLAKVVSGGELARCMLALRLVLSAGPETLVFDEVDAGIGGAAALAVGRALGALGAQHQVLVVTHLPQVAAYADAQVAVRKRRRASRTVTEVQSLDEQQRTAELARMLSGSPDSATAREHAAELLAAAGADR